MQDKQTGWVVINIGHPRTGGKYIVASTFSRTRREAISNFTNGTNEGWRYWKQKYNFRVVKASQVVGVENV